MPRFVRLDASTLGFPGGDPRVAVTVLTPRIVRVGLTQTGREAAPSYGADFDRLGATRQLWNTHIGHGPGSDMGVPLLVSSRGYALFFDNPGDAVVSVGRSDGGVRIVYTAETGRLVWYFLLGGDVRGVMREAAELLGRPPMPPRWAL